MPEITRESGDLIVRFPVREPQALSVVRNLPVRSWSTRRNAWVVPLNVENWQALVAAGFELPGEAPTISAYTVGVHQKMWAVRVPATPNNVEACQRIPDGRQWRPDPVNAWVCKPTRANLEYLNRVFPTANWDEAAIAMGEPLLAVAEQSKVLAELKADAERAVPDVNDYRFSPEYPPFNHQKIAFARSRDAEAFALLMEQGTGKSRVIVDTACWLEQHGKIDAVLVICPNSVKSNWGEEVQKFSPPHVRHVVVEWQAGLSETDKDKLRQAAAEPGVLPWLVMNVEALSSGKGTAAAEAYLSRYRGLMVVDESTRIKTPSANRTRAALHLGQLAYYRRILTGTPVTKGPLDLYTQFKFLDPHILGFSSFYAFRNHYALMGGFQGKQVIGYANLEELQSKILPFSYRVTSDECQDLPDKIYQRLEVELSDEQRKLYKAMKDEMLVEFSGREVGATIVLSQMLRLQQIVGGFLPVFNEIGETVGFEAIPGKNPKLEAMLELIEDTDSKAVIWARFRPEIELISRRLRELYGDESVVEFHGGVNENDRTAARRSFQDPGSPVRFFVGQTQTGGIGINLTEACLMIYFSNDFSLEARLQSEKRVHRYGLSHAVTIVDLVAKKTLDRKVIATLRSNNEVAAKVNGDNLKEWI